MIRNVMVDVDHKTGTVFGIAVVGCSKNGWFTPNELMHMVEQAGRVEELETEVKRLKDIDSALMDFNYEKHKKEREDFARKGFEEVTEARKRR